MKKKLRYIISFLIAFIGLTTKAQTFCFTPPESPNMDLYASTLGRSSVANSYCLKIYVHVIRRSNGTGGQSITEVNQALDYLDNDFNPHGVNFVWDGTIDYINNGSYYSTPSTGIYSVNNHSDGIDIYLFDDTANAGGRANGVGGSSEFWVSGSYWKSPFGSLVKSHVISHEMGHVLFLWHTHHGTFNEGGDPSQCSELVNGSNAATCGDYVADTPADPHIQFNVNHPACSWTGSGTDANGQNYNPDEAMIMAYSHPDCMSYFSNGQGQRIRNAIATLPHLINATVNCDNGCPTSLNITQNVSSGDTDIQKAQQIITATNIIQSNATAVYSAGNEIRLKTGFRAVNNSNFTAKIEACISNNFASSTIVDTPISSNKSNLSSTVVKLDFSTYPNPTKDFITIQHDTGSDCTIYIYDLYGLVKMTRSMQSKTTLNINNLSEGLYYIKMVLNNGKILTKKMIIKR